SRRVGRRPALGQSARPLSLGLVADHSTDIWLGPGSLAWRWDCAEAAYKGRIEHPQCDSRTAAKALSRRSDSAPTGCVGLAPDHASAAQCASAGFPARAGFSVGPPLAFAVFPFIVIRLI